MALFAFGALPVRPAPVAVKSDMCAMCGHKCCCPEMCGVKTSSCSIGKSQPENAVNLKHESAQAPRPALVSFAAFFRHDTGYRLFLKESIGFKSPEAEILTPPPRALP
jgi:hypothetical protein